MSGVDGTPCGWENEIAVSVSNYPTQCVRRRRAPKEVVLWKIRIVTADRRVRWRSRNSATSNKTLSYPHNTRPDWGCSEPRQSGDRQGGAQHGDGRRPIVLRAAGVGSGDHSGAWSHGGNESSVIHRSHGCVERLPYRVAAVGLSVVRMDDAELVRPPDRHRRGGG